MVMFIMMSYIFHRMSNAQRTRHEKRGSVSNADRSDPDQTVQFHRLIGVCAISHDLMASFLVARLKL